MAKSKIILLDSDVISHFMSTAKIDMLPKILSPHSLTSNCFLVQCSGTGFFLSEKGALIRDNDIRCKAGSMLAYMQNYN